MARKFIQMGVTRARRYANHKGGKKYGEDGNELPRVELEDEGKAEAARIFGRVLEVVKGDEVYVRLLKEHKEMYPAVKKGRVKKTTGAQVGVGDKRKREVGEDKVEEKIKDLGDERPKKANRPKRKGGETTRTKKVEVKKDDDDGMGVKRDAGDEQLRETKRMKRNSGQKSGKATGGLQPNRPKLPRAVKHDSA